MGEHHAAYSDLQYSKVGLELLPPRHVNEIHITQRMCAFPHKNHYSSQILTLNKAV